MAKKKNPTIAQLLTKLVKNSANNSTTINILITALETLVDECESKNKNSKMEQSTIFYLLGKLLSKVGYSKQQINELINQGQKNYKKQQKEVAELKSMLNPQPKKKKKK